MFETIAAGNTAGRDHFERKLFASFVIHSVIVGALIVMPMIFFQQITGLDPFIWILRTPEPAALPTPPPPKASGRPAAPTPAGQVNITRPLVLPPDVAPPANATNVPFVDLPSTNPDAGPCDGCFVGVPPINPGVVGTFTPTVTTRTPPPPPPTAARRPITVSILEPSALIYRVEPEYPGLAIQTRTQGVVKLSVLVDETGAVSEVRLVSGHPLLRQAAIDAVRQWRYKPTILNGEPIAVTGMVLVNFVLRSK